MKLIDAHALVEAWKDVIDGWKIHAEYCTNTEGLVVCVEIRVSQTEFIQPVKDGCCDPMDRHKYESIGQYVVVKGEATEKGISPITPQQLQDALDALLIYLT